MLLQPSFIVEERAGIVTSLRAALITRERPTRIDFLSEGSWHLARNPSPLKAGDLTCEGKKAIEAETKVKRRTTTIHFRDAANSQGVTPVSEHSSKNNCREGRFSVQTRDVSCWQPQNKNTKRNEIGIILASCNLNRSSRSHLNLALNFTFVMHGLNLRYKLHGCRRGSGQRMRDSFFSALIKNGPARSTSTRGWARTVTDT